MMFVLKKSFHYFSHEVVMKIKRSYVGGAE